MRTSTHRSRFSEPQDCAVFGILQRNEPLSRGGGLKCLKSCICSSLEALSRAKGKSPSMLMNKNASITDTVCAPKFVGQSREEVQRAQLGTLSEEAAAIEIPGVSALWKGVSPAESSRAIQTRPGQSQQPQNRDFMCGADQTDAHGSTPREGTAGLIQHAEHKLTHCSPSTCPRRN